jgi:hypothetical protein
MSPNHQNVDMLGTDPFTTRLGINHAVAGTRRSIARGQLTFKAFPLIKKATIAGVKELDANDMTVRFWQEIYDDRGKLVESHEKFPVDKGHQKV